MTSRKVLTPIEHERCRTALFNFLADGLKDHDNDMWRTIIWATNKLTRLNVSNASDEFYYLIMAHHELSVVEKNQIIHELTMVDMISGHRN